MDPPPSPTGPPTPGRRHTVVVLPASVLPLPACRASSPPPQPTMRTLPSVQHPIAPRPKPVPRAAPHPFHRRLQRGRGLTATATLPTNLSTRTSVAMSSFDEVPPESTLKAYLASLQAGFSVKVPTTGSIRSMAWAPPGGDSWKLITGDSVGGLTLIDANPYKRRPRGIDANADGSNRDHAATLSSVRFLPHRYDRVVSASLDGSLRLHSLDVGPTEAVDGRRRGDWASTVVLDNNGTGLTSCDVLPNHCAVLGSTTGALHVVDTKGWGAPRSTLQAHKLNLRVASVAACPVNPNLFASGGHDRMAAIWDMRRLASPLNRATVPGKVTSVTWSPCGTSLLATCGDAKLRLWRDLLLPMDGNVSQAISHLTTPGKFITPLQPEFSPLHPGVIVVGRNAWYSNDVLSGHMCRPVDVISLDTGKVVHQYTDRMGTQLASLNAFHASGTVLASGCRNTVVCRRRDP